MKVRVSASSLGAVSPYVLAASRALPLIALQLTVPSGTVSTEVRPVVRPDQRTFKTALGRDLFTIELNAARPDLIPTAIVSSAYGDQVDAYESFVASEGWREEMALEGPFDMQEEGPPAIFFDDRDLAAIALYEQ